MEENVLTTEEVLTQLEAFKTYQKQITAEREFHELYPDIDVGDLPDEITEQAESGIPLAAAYALYERKQFMARKKANKINLENAQRSSGNIEHDGSSDGTFTFEQIKNMSAEEVRRYYEQIMESLEKNLNKKH